MLETAISVGMRIPSGGGLRRDAENRYLGEL